MSTAREAAQAVTAVLNDPELSIPFDDRELLLDAVGTLWDYDE